MKHALIIVATIILVLCGCYPADAQTGTVKTPAQLTAEVNSFYPDNTSGIITPFLLRQGLLDIVASATFGNAVVGPPSSTLNDVATYNNTTGNLLADGGINVTTFTLPTVAGQWSFGGSSSLGLLLSGLGTVDDFQLQNSAGSPVMTVPTGATNVVFATDIKARSLTSSGSPPTITGSCTAPASQAGGNTSGSWTVAGGGACAGGTYILAFAVAAPNGWSCMAQDQTTAADYLKVNQTSSTASSATFTATTANSDVVSFFCMAY